MNDKPSGMEMMLRSMGLGDVITAAQQMSQSGTIQKIVAFADQTEVLINEQRRTQAMLAVIARHVGIADAAFSDLGTGDGTPDQQRLALPRPDVSA